MAKPKKQSTPEKAMDELTELSQELGLYDVEGNPLIKDTPTTSQEATGSTLVSKEDESNTVATPEAQNVSDSILEPLNDIDEELVLKDAWDRPISTKLVVIKDVKLDNVVRQLLFAGWLGGEIDPSFTISTGWPVVVRVRLPESNYDKFLSGEDKPVYNADTEYLKVCAQGTTRLQFMKSVIEMGKNGAILAPSQTVRKIPFWNVYVLCRSPVESTFETRVKNKVKYSKEELEEFNISKLHIVGSWYNISCNSKSKYIKLILEAQGS